jgi:dUTP pyrophosphatase
MEKNNLDLLKNKSEELQKMLNQDFEDINYDDIMNEFGVDIKGLEQDMLNYKPQLLLNFKKLHPDAVTPFYNYPTDSGFDLHSVDEITIPAFGRALVPTGLAFDIETGHEIQVRTKSGLAINQGLMVLNSPGTVDSGYISEIKAIIFNTNPHEFTITKGMKVAQGVYCPVANGEWVNLNEVKSIKDKDRNSNGFGSTGI